MFCKSCGKKMEKLKTDSSWEAKFRCECGQRLAITFADRMSGNHTDDYYYTDKPFKGEEPSEAIKESPMQKRLKENKCDDCGMTGGYHNQDCKYNPF